MKNIQKEVKKLKALLDIELHDNILKLCSVWSEIGIVDSQIIERSQKVAYHLNDLLSEMIEEDGKLKEKLIENAHKYTLMASQISSKLQVAFKEVKKLSDVGLCTQIYYVYDFNNQSICMTEEIIITDALTLICVIC